MKSTSIKLSTWSFLVTLYFFTTPMLFAQSIQIDPTYNINSIFINSFGGLEVGLIDSLKRIIVHGSFSNSNFLYREDIMRLDEFGNVDLSYSHFPYFYGLWGISHVTRSPNNHLIYDIGQSALTKTNENGTSYDSVWSANFASCNPNDNLLTVPDKINNQQFLIGIDGLKYPPGFGSNRFLFRVSPSGFIDSSFTHSPNDLLFRLIEYGSDKLILLGRFSNYDGVPNKFICRIDTLGNLDTTFQNNIVGGFTLSEVFVQNDGKLILAGNIILNNSLDTFQLIRIFPDGSLDSTFNNELEIWSDDIGMAIGCNTICQTRDSGFIIGGSFTEIDGHPRGRIAKIDMNGNLNLNEFNGAWVDSVDGINIGLDPWVRQVIADPYSAQERYYVGGDYNRVNGLYYNGLFRLIVDSTQIGIHENGLSKLNVRVHPNPFYENITISIPSFESNYNYTVVDISGKMIVAGILKSSVSTIDLGYLVKGFYLLNIENLIGHEKASIKIIK